MNTKSVELNLIPTLCKICGKKPATQICRTDELNGHPEPGLPVCDDCISHDSKYEMIDGKMIPVPECIWCQYNSLAWAQGC